MEERISVLVGIGASVTANCKPCLEFHAKKARELGLNEQEIQEAIDIGLMVKKGSTDVMKGVIKKVMGRSDATEAYDRPLTCGGFAGASDTPSCCR
jgi:AhpD family alkylhydroperoxidase